MPKRNKMKLEFADSFFDSLDDQDMTEEEKQELINEIGLMFESGELMQDAHELEEDEVPDEVRDAYDEYQQNNKSWH
jgi:hypothetical protein